MLLKSSKIPYYDYKKLRIFSLKKQNKTKTDNTILNSTTKKEKKESALYDN